MRASSVRVHSYVGHHKHNEIICCPLSAKKAVYLKVLLYIHNFILFFKKEFTINKYDIKQHKNVLLLVIIGCAGWILPLWFK